MASPAAPAPTVHVLTDFVARPPTPPRESCHDIDVSLRSIVLGRSQSFDPHRSLHTPPGAHSPPSLSATGSDTSFDRVRKRVEWSSHTDYKDPPDYRDGSRPDKSRLLSTPSSASPRPIKGILKPSPAPSLLSSFLVAHPDGNATEPNLVEMLDSSIKQLAGPDRDSKLDAYMMLARALKISNNLPDRVALQNKMSLFTQFIQRDVTCKNDNGTLDSSLVNHALTLLATFLHFPAIASTIPSEFAVFIIDHAIRSFEDPSVPKDIIRHIMQVVAFQSFSPKVMAPDRVGRLVAALHKIEDHVQGKSIVMSRLHIYKRLIKQARSSMLVHSDWLKDMFTDMLSTIRDIRAQAIGLGTEAGFALRSDKLLLRKVAEILTANDQDGSYIGFYIRRLQRMVKDKQVSYAVPQIWSVVILFLRCPLDRWEHYAPWLRLVQDAFNMTDGPTKQEANYAWNRYVCLSILDGKTGPKVVGTLCKPLLSQLRRKASPKQQDDALKLRRTVLGGVCSLYYYAIAQGDEKCPIEVIWDVAVQPVMTQLIDVDGKPDVPGDCMMQAARILGSLLDVTTPRPPRNPDRIMEPTPLQPEELLPIDYRWIRRNCDKVFQAVEPILEKKLVDLANKDSVVYRLWQALVGSIAAASAKDIKVSEDTIRFLACSLRLLARAWSNGPDEDDGSAKTKFLPSVHHYIQVLADGLGTLPFMEKRVSLSTTNTFEVAAVPLMRSDKSERPLGGPQTPLYHLFSMLSAIPPNFADDDELADMLQSVFRLFSKGRNVKASLELSRELIQSLPRISLSPYGPWLLAAENLKSALREGVVGSGARLSSGETLLGPQYRELVSLLERGLANHPNLPCERWTSLFDHVSSSIFEECGDAGRALVFIEPLAKAMLNIRLSNNSAPRTSIRATKMLFDVANLPRDRKALDTARIRLWGAPPVATKVGSSDPFDNLYKLACHQMEALYDKYPALESVAEWNALGESACAFFERCMAMSVVKTATKMHNALRRWVEDEKQLLQLPDLAPFSCALQQLWDRFCTSLAAHRPLERREFDQVEPLLVSALKSKQAFIVNKTAAMWNALMREGEKVECSDDLKSVLSSLRSELNLVMPGLGPSQHADFDAQVSAIDQPHVESLILSSATSKQAVSSTSSAVTPPVVGKRQKTPTPEAARRSSKRPGISRLRHEDSQIQFAAITTPALMLEESQHLTDRQREVRERQLENAALYSSIHSGGPTPAFEAAAKTSNHDGKRDRAESDCLPRDTTPTRSAFDDLVRSTPTPRRGQALPVDYATDPPSSPPVPRPCPLLSEIRSRSRASSSLDDWEFSSPTGSPVARSQEVSLDDRTISPIARAKGSPRRSRKRTRRQRVSTAARRRSTDVIPSSIPDDCTNATGDGEKPRPASPAIAKPPSTPPRSSDVLATSKMWETPNFGEDEFVDARSSPERASPELLEIHVAQYEDEDETDTSVAFSESVEKAAGNLAIELESRRHEAGCQSGDSPGKVSSLGDEYTDERILAMHESPRGPTTRGESRRLASLAAAATPMKDHDEEAKSGARGKRKRSGATATEKGSKRRRTDELKKAALDTLELGKPDLQTSSPRRSARQKAVAVKGSSSRSQRPRTGTTTVPKVGSMLEAEARDEEEAEAGGDTDQELMSQLATESFAASQKSESQGSAKTGTRNGAKQESHKPGGATGTKRAGAAESELYDEAVDGGQTTSTILGTLRSGLEQLRQAALGREAVYELEDVLMDLKRELYDAEKRGRGGKERRSRRGPRGQVIGRK